MRRLAAGTAEVDELIGALREEHRRGTRLQRESDLAGSRDQPTITPMRSDGLDAAGR